MKIGDRIRQLRKENGGMTQKQLAEKLEIKPSTVGMYEQGRRSPDSEMIVKLCKVLGVSSDNLLGLERESDEITDVVKNMAESIRHDSSIMLNGDLLTDTERESVINAIEVAARVALLKKEKGKAPFET